MRLPNLFVPGAQRSATTLLASILDRSDACAFGARKEPHFFSKDRRYDLGLEDYATLLPEDSAAHYVVDASQSYLPLPFVPERIHATVGDDVRFIISLRGPVARAVSAFKHYSFHAGGDHRSMSQIVPDADVGSLAELLDWEARTVRSALHDGSLESRNATWTDSGFPFRYFHVSAYADQIRRYLALWPRDRFLFLRYEDVTAGGPDLAARLGAFLETEIDVAPAPDRMNKSRTFRSVVPTGVRELALRGSAVLKRSSIGRRIQPGASDIARRVLLSDESETLAPATRSRLGGLFRAEIAEVEALTGLDLDVWRE